MRIVLFLKPNDLVMKIISIGHEKAVTLVYNL